jgi:hypothetical protein
LFWIRNVLLAVYCVVGVAGWYKYSVLSDQKQQQQYDQLSPDLTVSYVRAIVWYHSRGKLQELRSIIKDDNLDDETRVKTRITNMLQHRTSVYIREMNSLHAPINNLGSWYQENFDFDSFLDDVFDTIFNKKYSVDEKINFITDIMEKYQNMTTQKLISVMK